MKILHDKATTALRAAMNDPEVKPLYIFDNVGLQKKSGWRRIGYSQHSHVKTPPHSPDFNKPIEHCFNQIKRTLLERVVEECDVALTPELAQQWVLEAFESITQASIQRDVKSLVDTWRIVSTKADEEVCTEDQKWVKGSWGDYISVPKYR